MGINFFYSYCVISMLLAVACESSFVPNLLMPRSRSRSGGNEFNCLSWRLAVETDNIRGQLVPESCKDYVRDYMYSSQQYNLYKDDPYVPEYTFGQQYEADCNAVVDSAITYAQTLNLNLPNDEKKENIWVFDIDETALSNLPYYARPDLDFGVKKYNKAKFDEWVKTGKAKAVPGVVRLYQELVQRRIKVVFLSGSSESNKDARTKNLIHVGYSTWEKLILKTAEERGKFSSVDFKSKKRGELETQGYRVVGNIGDQWSDLIGTHVGNRTFKLPNPMYYVG